ncbi:hypothetical protein JKP88DRAFT_249255 [Tribonema minus]|uniref:Uncharacterized protein n=1 Tax=Tribonema minus TaxID=303371 RepID=A0A835YLH8_9STRA|nr:hypothetical protein JKP88DRAFT_249255 [Tribonema minus]
MADSIAVSAAVALMSIATKNTDSNDHVGGHRSCRGTWAWHTAAWWRVQRACAGQISAYHSTLSIAAAVAAIVGVFHTLRGNTSRFVLRGGSEMQRFLQQTHVRARPRRRNVIAYLHAKLLRWVCGQRDFVLAVSCASVGVSLSGFIHDQARLRCSSMTLNRLVPPARCAARASLGGAPGRAYACVTYWRLQSCCSLLLLPTNGGACRRAAQARACNAKASKQHCTGFEQRMTGKPQQSGCASAGAGEGCRLHADGSRHTTWQKALQVVSSGGTARLSGCGVWKYACTSGSRLVEQRLVVRHALFRRCVKALRSRHHTVISNEQDRCPVLIHTPAVLMGDGWTSSSSWSGPRHALPAAWVMSCQ